MFAARRPHPLVEIGQSCFDRFDRHALPLGIQRQVDATAAGSRRLRDRVVEEVAADPLERLGIGRGRGEFHRPAEQRRQPLGGIRGREVAVHQAEHAIALPAEAVVLPVRQMIEIAGRLIEQRDQRRGLERGQPAYVGLAEKRAGGRAKTLERTPAARPQPDAVDIGVEDRFLRKDPLDRHRDADLAEFPAERPAAIVEHVHPRHLHRDRRCAAADERRQREPAEVKSVMGQEPAVLARDNRIEERRPVDRRHRNRLVARPVLNRLRLGERQQRLGLEASFGEWGSTGGVDRLDAIAGPVEAQAGKLRVAGPDRQAVRRVLGHIAARRGAAAFVIADGAEVIDEARPWEDLASFQPQRPREDAEVRVFERGEGAHAGGAGTSTPSPRRSAPPSPPA